MKKPSSDLIPILSHLFAPFDSSIGKKSLTFGMHEAGESIFGKGNIQVEGLEKTTRAILEKEPVVVICNHPFDTEVIVLLGALPQRADIRMVGADSQARMGYEFRKYVITVYPFRQEQEGKDLKLSSRVARHTYRKSSGLTPEEMQKHNRAAITQASQVVNNGGLVVMFPQGTSSKIVFRSGIGYLISQLLLKKPTYLGMAYITGCTNFDLLRIIPGAKRLFPHPKIVFRPPMRLSSQLVAKPPKEIAADVEKEYLSWIQHL